MVQANIIIAIIVISIFVALAIAGVVILRLRNRISIFSTRKAHSVDEEE